MGRVTCKPNRACPLTPLHLTGRRASHVLLWFVACACTRHDDHLRNSGPLRPTVQANRATMPNTAPISESARLSAVFDERKDEREQLVKSRIEPEGINDPHVLAAMLRVPRHHFMPPAVRDDAYANRPVPIGSGQTISQPYIVALMTQAVRIKPKDRCLEIGTGSGYQAAILAEICAKTYSVEYLPDLAAFAKSNLEALRYNVELRTGDGYRGWPEAAPFDVILVTAAPQKVPPPLLEQLALGGRLVIPVGDTSSIQILELWTRIGSGNGPEAFERLELAAVRFVPFLGKGPG